MTKTIYKYLLTPNCTIDMPEGTKILCVQVKDNYPYIWVLADPTAPLIGRKLVTIGTGSFIDDSKFGKYVSTFQLDSLVFHVFEQQ